MGFGEGEGLSAEAIVCPTSPGGVGAEELSESAYEIWGVGAVCMVSDEIVVPTAWGTRETRF